MSINDEMRAEAERHPAGSNARKMLTWAALELADRAELIASLEAETLDWSDQYSKLGNALHEAQLSLESVTAAIHAALWKPEHPARDVTSFHNCMMAHGVEPYAKPKRKKKEVAP